ncbi:copper resistance protein CopC [Microcella sp.]|uniref:copper resistance CopC family protein n=1 Tax=Microcella sp. TaxID=1913979 RepID=UPI003918D4E4
MTIRTRTAPLFATLALTAALALAPAAAAMAHDPVTTSTPSPGQVLTTVPEVFSVSTNQPMLDLSGDAAGFGLQVTDAAGLYYGDGCLTVAGDTLSMPATLGAAGEYTLTYQYVSSDGHTLSDTIAFSFAPVDAAEARPGLAEPPVCGQPLPEPSSSATTEPQPEPTTAATPVAEAADDAADESAVVLGIIAAIVAGLVVLGVVIAVLARRGRSSGAAEPEAPRTDAE